MPLSIAIKTSFPWLETLMGSSGAMKMPQHFALVLARARQLRGGIVAQMHVPTTS
jgi:hypothetical protein